MFCAVRLLWPHLIFELEMKVVGLGEVVWDIFGTSQKQGGAPCNFGMHMAQLGFDSYVITAVGDDELGKKALDTIHSFGAKTVDPVVNYETSTVIITLNNGIPSYNVKLNVAWDHLEMNEKKLELAKDTVAVCFGTIALRSEETRKSIMTFLRSMNPNSYRVFDVNLRQHFYSDQVILDSLSLSNIVKMSDEEVFIVGQACGIVSDDMLEVFKGIHNKYAMKYSLLTLGDKGSYVLTGDKCIFCEASHVNAVNTVGAGDSFTAIFCGMLLRGKPVEECQRLASEVAGYVCTQETAMPRLPQDMLKRMLQ